MGDDKKRVEIKEEIQKLTHSILSGWLQCPSFLKGTKEADEWNARLQQVKSRLDEQLVAFFKSYARSLIPEKRNSQVEYFRTGDGDYERVYDPREINFTEGWNACREEILKKLTSKKRE